MAYWKCEHCGLELTFKEVCQSSGHDCEPVEQPRSDEGK